MKVLFVHGNFPAQYKHLAAAIGRDPRHQAVFLTTNPKGELAGVDKVLLDMTIPNPAGIKAHKYLREYESQINRGEGFFRGFEYVKSKGFHPDVIAIHPGWGAGLFVRDAFPDTPILTYHEFWRPPDQDIVDSEPPRPLTVEETKFWRVHVSRSLSYLTWTDWGITPTHWQKSTFPDIFHPRISVLHEGIDSEALDPAKVALQPLVFPDGTRLTPQDEIVTYVARDHEPTRGFPTVARAIQKIQQQRPNCHFVLLGGDKLSYSGAPPGGGTWRDKILQEVDLDRSKIHMPGHVDYHFYQGVLRASRAHIYLTTRFVLSWSMLEAMALGCLIIGSATPPVQEVITHGANGLLADFHDDEEIARLTLEALRQPEKMQPLRAAARQTVISRYALRDLLPLHIDLLQDLAERRIPPPTAARIARRGEGCLP